ncbi:MAG: tyrosine-type recombinase/integrase, partial [Planctomycetota bacterium]|nr:tyrosine-type recombinase/integrase [Planctomycetota bacterium]
CAQQNGRFGKRLDRRNARSRFIAACRVLGTDRSAEITIHHGRHSFISHALAGGRSLAEVAESAGHANITITAIYTHVAVDDDGQIGSLFNFNPNGNGDPRP